jgi:mono/diheme cytochrome c family protein
MKKRFLIAGVSAVVVAGVCAIALSFTLSALPEPGRTETYFATKAKHYLVWRGARDGVPARAPDEPGALNEGEKLFGRECAACHGLSGRDPTDAGRWMYPRAANLSSPDSQSYSDQEIFWIIKNGIRLSGMPALGKVEPDEHIWDLVLYVRTLPKAAAAQQ